MLCLVKDNIILEMLVNTRADLIIKKARRGNPYKNYHFFAPLFPKKWTNLTLLNQ